MRSPFDDLTGNSDAESSTAPEPEGKLSQHDSWVLFVALEAAPEIRRSILEQCRAVAMGAAVARDLDDAAASELFDAAKKAAELLAVGGLANVDGWVKTRPLHAEKQ